MEDMHIHLKDGINNYDKMKEYINKCINMGINKVVFLDHGNRISPKHSAVIYDKEIINNFFSLIECAKREYPDISINSGIEVDFSFDEDFREREIEIMNSGFDYVLGSVHGMKELSKSEYYTANKLLIDVYPINVLAHLKLDDNYLNYSKQISEIVRKCALKNIKIEINTSDRSIWSLEQLKFMMNLIRKYNCEYTIGSDAHKVDEIGYNLEKIYSNLEKLC